MSRLVPHLRPEPDYDPIRSGAPVSAADWADLGGLANWCNGHGAQLIPCTWVGTAIGDDTSTFRFYVAPSARAVERVWSLNILGSSDDPITITCATASALTVIPPRTHGERRGPIIIREPLSAKSDTPTWLAVTIEAFEAFVTVESIACYEQTRRILDADATDDGVDLTTCRVRQPIVDVANGSLAGVVDAQKDLDARRAGLWHWSPGSLQAVSPGSESLADLFDANSIFALGAAGTTSLTFAAYAYVTGGTGQIKLTIGSDTVTLNVTSTSAASVTGTLTLSAAEDLSTAIGYPGDGSAHRGVVEALDPSGQTLFIEALSIVRTTTPI